jgi:hypothetical protein
MSIAHGRCPPSPLGERLSHEIAATTNSASDKAVAPTNSSVRVVVRIRPLSWTEQDRGCRGTVYPLPTTAVPVPSSPTDGSRPGSPSEAASRVEDESQSVASKQSTISLNSTGSHTKDSTQNNDRRFWKPLQTQSGTTHDNNTNMSDSSPRKARKYDLNDDLNDDFLVKSDATQPPTTSKSNNKNIPGNSKHKNEYMFSKSLLVETSNYNRQFEFDAVFGSEASQKDVYCNGVGDVVGNIFQGYNTTIIAYGQTGSG